MVKEKVLKQIGLYALILLVVLFCIFPFVQMLSTSLKFQWDWGNPSLIPKKFNFKSYGELLGLVEHKVEIPETIKKLLANPKLSKAQREKILKKFQSTADIFPFIRYFGNSLVVSLLAASGSLILSIFGAYSFSRLRYKGRGSIQRGVLFVYMFGGVLLMVPLYQMSVKVGLAGTAFGSILSLIIIYLVQTLPVSLYMLGNYFRTIPYSLEEAALMDGCTRMQAIYNIIIPISVPMIVTVFVYSFMIAWNEFLFASVFLRNYADNFTLPIALKTLFDSKNAIWDRIMAASMMTAIPVVILFIFFEKRLTGGLSEGGVKE